MSRNRSPGSRAVHREEGEENGQRQAIQRIGKRRRSAQTRVRDRESGKKGGEEAIIDHNERVIDNRSDGLSFLFRQIVHHPQRATHERFNCSLLALTGCECVFGARTGDQSSDRREQQEPDLFLALVVKIDTLAVDWWSTCMQ